jgi:hypothetical protein
MASTGIPPQPGGWLISVLGSKWSTRKHWMTR